MILAGRSSWEGGGRPVFGRRDSHPPALNIAQDFWISDDYMKTTPSGGCRGEGCQGKKQDKETGSALNCFQSG